MFKKAIKSKSPARVLLYGASGSGKTIAALELAYGFTKDWDSVYVIDTESSASKYAHDKRSFNVVELETCSLTNFLEPLEWANKPGNAIIIDSITHLWSGVGGLMDYQKELETTARYIKNPMGSWTEINQMMSRFFNAIKKSEASIICTCRTKDKMFRPEGSKTFIKLPDQPMFREGYLDFEFDVAFMLEQDHSASCYKDRTQIFDGMHPEPITAETARKIMEWAQSGKGMEVVREELVAIINKAVADGKLDTERAEKARNLPDDKLKAALNKAKRELC